MKKYIPINLPKNNGGENIAPCVTAHYHKGGAHCILTARRMPEFGIIVVNDDKKKQTSRGTNRKTL